MYLTDYDEEDLWEDLRRRTQGEREKVSAYLTSMRYIAMQIRHKPKVDRVVYRAYRNLRPEYRLPITFDEIEEWGIQYEKMKDLDCRWEAPPNAKNMHAKSRSRVGMARLPLQPCPSARKAGTLLKLPGNGRQRAERRARRRVKVMGIILRGRAMMSS